MTLDDLHSELSGFRPEVIAVLEAGGFWDLEGTYDPVEFYSGIPKNAKEEYKKESTQKNSRIWDIVKAVLIGQAIQAGITEFKKSYPARKINPSAQDYMNSYIKEHGGEFIKNMGRTDQQKLVGFIWANAGAHERPLSKQIANQPHLKYALDQGKHRYETIVRTEKFRATEYGTFRSSKDAGFKTKTRRSAGDKRVRPSHRALSGITVPIDKPFPNGEMFPGESSINCRCRVEYGLDAGKIDKNAAKTYTDNLAAYEKQAKAERAELATVRRVAPTAEPRKVAPKVEPRKVTEKVKPAKVSEKIEKVAEKLVPPTKADLTYAERASLKDYTEEDYSFVNKYLRGQLKESPGRADIVKTAEEHIANIDSAMARNTLPKQTVYRALEHVEWYNNLDGLKGTTISDKAFISTTKSKKLASDYTLSHRKAGVIMEISLPEGAKGIDILGSEVTTKTIQRGEQEILLNRGGKFRVVDAKMVPPEGMGPDVAYIKVELIA